jgi:hypothetical protein
LRDLRRRRNLFPALLIPAALLLFAGCLHDLKLEKPWPLRVDPRDYQPVALLPIQDPRDSPGSADLLSSVARDQLTLKRYTLIDPAKVSEALRDLGLTPQALLLDQASRIKLKEQLQAKALIVGTILEYRLEKSYVRSESFLVWDGATYDYRTLPTYHQGMCQIGIKFRLMEAETGAVLWTTEGRIRGPNTAAETLGKRLVNRLLGDLPSIPPKG